VIVGDFDINMMEPFDMFKHALGGLIVVGFHARELFWRS